MANKKMVWGMSGVLLAFMLALGGCDANAGDGITLLDLAGIVSAPVGGTTIVSSIDTAEYDGSIFWKNSANNDIYGTFQQNTVYVALIALHPKSGYTFTGVGTFTHSRATAITQENISEFFVQVTITFPETPALIKVSPRNLNEYITAVPVAGEESITVGTIDNAEYSGTMVWRPEADDSVDVSVFQQGTVYKAVLSLTAKPGYTFYGLASDTFTCTGADWVALTATSSGTYTHKITVTFPATANPDSPLTNANQIAAYVASKQSPVALKLQLELSTANWQAILAALNAAEKNVQLDMSACTASGSTAQGGLAANGTFDPYLADTDEARKAGKRRIRTLILPNAATSIPAGSAFQQTFIYFGLRAISGAHVETIGDNAFHIQIDYEQTNLTSANFPAVQDIGDAAFSNCTNLTNISMPVVETIRYNAFSGCTNLTNVSMPVVETIGYNAFYDCTNLTNVSMPVVETIGSDAFSGCTNLTNVSMPVVETIGYNAFSGCTNLTNVSMPVVETIGYNAFYNCKNLTSVSLPATANIGDGVFLGCRNAIFTVTGTGVLSTDDNGKMLIKNNTLLLAYSLPPSDITLPNTLTGIDNGVFSAAYNLTSISASGVLSIGNEAFSDCPNLATVNIPKAESIGSYTFTYTGTTALTVTLGATPPTLGSSIFSSVSSPKNVTVRVPTASTSAYSSGYDNGNTSNNNWGNAFRGKGWNGESNYLFGTVNTNISLTFVGY